MTWRKINLSCFHQCRVLTRFKQRCFTAQMLVEHVCLHQVAALCVIQKVHGSIVALVSKLILLEETKV